MPSEYWGRNRRDSAPDSVVEMETRLAPILIVDDRPGNLLSLHSILEPLQQKIVHAESGDEALRQVLSNDFAVILMDVRMPGLDGMETVQLIRQRHRSATVPVIFLTAVAIGSADILKAYDEGAVDFLLKPFEPNILRSKVKVFVDLYLKEQTIKRQTALLMQRDREAFERRSELRFRNLLDSMPIAVLALRPNGTVYYWNKTVADWVRTPFRDQSDSSLLEIVCQEDRERVAAAWNDALRRQGPLETQFRMQGKSDGAYRWYLCRIVPQCDENGAVTSWICAATDIDTQHEAREEAESANRMKDEFLATVSHELRNPLNAILGWTHLLRTRTLSSEKAAHGLEVIDRNVRSQSALIDDILDVARVTYGKLHLNLKSVDMAQVTEAALSAVRPAAESKEISVEYHLPVGETIEVNGDGDRLQQVVWNLLSNAIKFTPGGGSVRVDLRRDGADAELAVGDNGQGIRSDFLPFIFDRFRQAEAGSKRLHGGLGLGLSISRELVEMHRGTIRVQSDGEGKGATFIVRLPLRPEGDGTPTIAGAEPASSVSLAGIKVLVVDDESDSRETTVELLIDYGAQATGASSAQEALAAIKTWRPDVLISDIGMPHEDGYDLIRKVRALDPGEGGGTPACALTGWGSTREGERALAAGFQVHLAKPIDSQRLTATVYGLARGSSFLST